MTTFMIDIASYQDGINLDAVRKAGFSWINIKTSEGTSYLYSNRKKYADIGRSMGFGISSFHYLRNGNGRLQAEIALREMRSIGATIHQCDNEADADWQTTRDYLTHFIELGGKGLYFYTGDWWLAPKGWNVAAYTPYLMAAPNSGYPGSYPGDDSPLWKAGYGGYARLSAMQYAVKPIKNANGGNISLTAWNDIALSVLNGGSQVALSQSELDAIATAVWTKKLGSGNGKEAHFYLTDVSDQVGAGKSQYDGQQYYLPVTLNDIKSTVETVLTELGSLTVTIDPSTLDVNAITTKVANDIVERIQNG
jgi:hypothetical protein